MSSGRIAAVRTGWEPETPVADTLLRRSVFALAEAWEPAVAALGGRVRRCAAFALADLRRPAGLANAVTLLQPLPHPPDPVLDAIQAEVSGGTGTVCLVSAWPTPDLTARGWQLLGYPPLHMRPPAPIPTLDAPAGLRIAHVADIAAVRDFERVLVEGYPFPDVIPGTLFDARLLAASGPHLEIGYLDERAVTVGARHIAHGLLVLALGATLPEARHHGCWAAMVRSRLAAAPGLAAVALFSDDSRPGAERLFGFLPITRFTLWMLPRPSLTPTRPVARADSCTTARSGPQPADAGRDRGEPGRCA
jgi:hypothetical protein